MILTILIDDTPCLLYQSEGTPSRICENGLKLIHKGRRDNRKGEMWYSCIQNGHVGGHMNQSTEERLISILKRELIPAMGCTEPIAIALAAAKAREVLGTEPKKIRVGCSSNIIKNVK